MRPRVTRGTHMYDSKPSSRTSRKCSSSLHVERRNSSLMIGANRDVADSTTLAAGCAPPATGPNSVRSRSAIGCLSGSWWTAATREIFPRESLTSIRHRSAKSTTMRVASFSNAPG